MAPTFDSRGILSIAREPAPTLDDLEEFCRQARALGVIGSAPLRTSRQGLMGPITSWHFLVPVVPEVELLAAQLGKPLPPM